MVLHAPSSPSPVIVAGFLEGMEVTCSPNFGSQTIETMDTKELEFPLELFARERKNWYQPEGSLSPWKKFHTVLTICQNTLWERRG